MGSTSLSQRVLEVSTNKLMVLAVTGVERSDLGEPRRVLSTLESIGIQANWTHKYDNLVRKIA